MIASMPASVSASLERDECRCAPCAMRRKARCMFVDGARLADFVWVILRSFVVVHGESDDACCVADRFAA